MAQAPPCPYCGASSYQLREKRWLLCKACGQEFDLQRDLCPVCKHLNQTGAQACGNCGAALREDKVDRLIAERGKDLLDWREERTKVGVAQKKAEEEASRQRMEAYWADDRARREAAARARAEQREKEKKVLIAVGIVAAIIIIALVVVAVLMSLGGEPDAESATHLLMPQAIWLLL
jgi:hypothetical protein